MVVGFTGTHKGMSFAQRDVLVDLLRQHQPVAFHHGDCVGADEQAAYLAYTLGIPVVAHPPADPKQRANTSWGTVLPPASYGDRNQAIVDACDLLIAAPAGPERLRGSGTWWTVRMARRAEKSIQVVWIDGRVLDGRQREAR